MLSPLFHHLAIPPTASEMCQRLSPSAACGFTGLTASLSSLSWLRLPSCLSGSPRVSRCPPFPPPRLRAEVAPVPGTAPLTLSSVRLGAAAETCSSSRHGISPVGGPPAAGAPPHCCVCAFEAFTPPVLAFPPPLLPAVPPPCLWSLSPLLLCPTLVVAAPLAIACPDSPGPAALWSPPVSPSSASAEALGRAPVSS